MKFGNKFTKPEVEQFLKSVLDAQQDTDIVVVRGKSCETLFMNSTAQARLNGAAKTEESCKRGFSSAFPDLCDHCPVGNEGGEEAPEGGFDIHDEHGKWFSVRSGKLEWIDGKPAHIFFLRDVDTERTAQQKLYNLAYVDYLTGVPNRQKLKEDFEAHGDEMESGKKTGLLAIFDLDNFKNINDTYGHGTGDIMLKRLTEHLEGMAAFKGHLYRLGGDEFVLFYPEPASAYASPEAQLKHYEELLSAAFLTYTMPNIEAHCTISMGAALIGPHGTSFSELLRKADIALYQAKASGRNRLVFFEDRYDTAKKFKDLYINMQPILTHAGTTYGYEMVDRGNEGKGSDGEMNLAGFDRTMDALGLSDMGNDAKYFIAFSNQLLNRTVLSNLPKTKFVIQAPVPCGPDSDRQLKKYADLKGYGYSIALIGVTATNLSPALVGIADFFKFAPEVGQGEQKRMIAKYPAKRFVATRVDDAVAFQTAKDLGFKLYQGFFFETPVVLKKTKEIDPMKVNYFRLLKLSSSDGYVDFREISSVISSDVALSYKLLRLLNSAALGLRNQVSSIDMAVAYLGEESLKKWIAMLALRGLASDKPLELVRLSLIRAQFGEMLAPMFNPPKNAKHVFLVGLFSLLHIALEKPREELLDEIPVADDIRASLLTASGPYSGVVQFFTDYEYSNWDEVTQFARENRLSDRQINEAYMAAVKWYNDLAEQ